MERCNARTMEIYRRMGIAERVRAAGLPRDCPMDVFIVALARRAAAARTCPIPSVAEAKARDRGLDRRRRMPLEPYQLISQYTLEPLLKSVAEDAAVA